MAKTFLHNIEFDLDSREELVAQHSYDLTEDFSYPQAAAADDAREQVGEQYHAVLNAFESVAKKERYTEAERQIVGCALGLLLGSDLQPTSDFADGTLTYDPMGLPLSGEALVLHGHMQMQLDAGWMATLLPFVAAAKAIAIMGEADVEPYACLGYRYRQGHDFTEQWTPTQKTPIPAKPDAKAGHVRNPAKPV